MLCLLALAGCRNDSGPGPGTAAVRLQEADHVLQEHAFPLTASADDRGQFAGWNVEINALQDALTAQRFFHPDEFDHGYSNTDVRK